MLRAILPGVKCSRWIDRPRFLGRSVVPSVWGWNAVDNADLIPKSFSSSMNALEANCGPRSEMSLLGNPNLSGNPNLFRVKV